MGDALTPGFRAIREPGAAVSVMLVLSDGQVALGDCAEVQYPGAGGRAPVFSAPDAIAEIRDHVAPLLLGRTVAGFRELAGEVDAYRVGNGRLATAVRYGVSQALLHAAALAARHHDGRGRTEGIPDRHRTRFPCRCLRRPAMSGTRTSTR